MASERKLQASKTNNRYAHAPLPTPVDTACLEMSYGSFLNKRSIDFIEEYHRVFIEAHNRNITSYPFFPSNAHRLGCD